MKLGNISALSLVAALGISTAASATDLEVTHWWTSAGEAAAVAEFARAFNETGHNWIDGAIAGSSGTAIPIIVNRIIGGNPMGAAQMPRGRQAEELIEAGLLRDINSVVDAEDWRDFIRPASLMDSCTVDGRVYCVPLDIHSFPWIWLSNQAFADAGVDVPSNWDEFVAAGPALVAAGHTPLAVGGQPWQHLLIFNVMLESIGGEDLYYAVYRDYDADAARSAGMTAVFEALAQARELSAGSRVQGWNEATNLVITGQAGGQIMGDWAQAEFAVAGQVAGTDYTCLPGLGVSDVVTSSGDAFYFPVLSDPEASAAQEVLASTLMSRAAQLAFNLRKGSLPVRGDLDLSAANDCMRRGNEILDHGTVLPPHTALVSPDTSSQIQDVVSQFMGDPSYTVADAQELFAEIISNAD